MLFTNVCAGFIHSCYGELWERRFFFFAYLLCLVCLGGASFAGPLVAHMTWVTLVCLLLDTPFRRRSVGALPL